jgi:hypothetical protein
MRHSAANNFVSPALVTMIFDAVRRRDRRPGRGRIVKTDMKVSIALAVLTLMGHIKRTTWIV